MSTKLPNPLSIPFFRALWIATVFSNIGTAMHETGAQWLMTSLSPSPLMVSLVLTVTALPIVILSIPSGSMADIFDRRKILLITQAIMVLIAGLLAFLTLTDLITTELLLVITFVLGLGAAMSTPSMIGMSLSLSKNSDKRTAISLGGVGINIGRAAGPAIAGFLMVFAGPWIVFALNAVTFVGLISVLVAIRNDPQEKELFPEHVIGAIQDALRYVRHSPKVHALLIRDGAFAFFGSVIFALLPLYAKIELGLDSDGFGMLGGSFGIGAIICGFFILPKIQQRLSVDKVVVTGSIMFAGVMFVFATHSEFTSLLGALFICGIAQILVMSSLNFAAYKSSPVWIGLRILSVHLLIFQASITIGSIVWGSLAEMYGMPMTFMIAGVGILAAFIVMIKFRLPAKDTKDLIPSMHWPTPQVIEEIDKDDGPVLVQIQYNIEPKDFEKFGAEMQNLKEIRLRDGSMSWHLFHDMVQENRFIETFLVGSWSEHMRQHERFTTEDKEIQDIVNSFHKGDNPPKVSHYMSERLGHKKDNNK